MGEFKFFREKFYLEFQGSVYWFGLSGLQVVKKFYQDCWILVFNFVKEVLKGIVIILG